MSTEQRAKSMERKPERQEQSAKSKRTGLAGIAREAMKKLGTFTRADLAAELAVTTRYALQRAKHNVVRDFRRSGEIREVEPGRFRYMGRRAWRTKLDIIWHLVRSHRQFTTDDIERLSGAARDTVLEYLNCLLKFDYLRRPRLQHWQLVKDPGPQTPVNMAKCQRFRERARKGLTRRRRNGGGMKP